MVAASRLFLHLRLFAWYWFEGQVGLPRIDFVLQGRSAVQWVNAVDNYVVSCTCLRLPGKKFHDIWSWRCCVYARMPVFICTCLCINFSTTHNAGCQPWLCVMRMGASWLAPKDSFCSFGGIVFCQHGHEQHMPGLILVLWLFVGTHSDLHKIICSAV
jgi:hypothetical protein